MPEGMTRIAVVGAGLMGHGIAQVFARRGFNIESLVVSPAKEGERSPLAPMVIRDRDGLQQIIAQVNKL